MRFAEHGLNRLLDERRYSWFLSNGQV